ncbi:MAG TPA: nitroreductase family deazaflavin-dependent oxidoreductase [Ilumatobacteraceae bacterium]|jgi:deazaflavin-dependent oxidoreductase (nitroreductase family)
MAEANDWNTRIIEEFRANGGKVGGQFAGAPLLLLHTTGAKTGQARVNPMMYLADGDDHVVFASKAGAPTNPDWYHNLVANPRASIEVGDQTFNVVARVAEGETRERLWSRQKELYPGFADYEAKTTRQIPVVILETEA